MFDLDIGVLWLWFGYLTFSDDIKEFVFVFLQAWTVCNGFLVMFEWKHIDKIINGMA